MTWAAWRGNIWRYDSRPPDVEAAIELLETIRSSSRPADAILLILFQEEALRGRWRPARNPITRLRRFEKQAQLDWWCHRAGIAPNVRQRVLAALSFRIAWEGIRLDTYLRVINMVLKRLMERKSPS